MAIEHLSPKEIRDWTPAQKDAWWLEKVYRGNMPQLTIRSAATGFFLGGVLSATNLYIGAKTGWTLGVGLTSVILAYAAFRLMSRAGVRDMTILENNASQSVATAAGYMTTPLVSGIAAYMWIENALIPWWQMMLFNMTLSLLGVLVAFPMKRRFINDEQQPFPEGAACGVVLDALYTSGEGSSGMYKAKILAKAAALAGFIGVISGENIMKLVQQKWMGFKSFWHLPHNVDAVYYWMVDKGWVPMPKLAGVPLPSLGLTISLDLAMFGAGGLMGIRVAGSLLVGMLLNFVVIVPSMISIGEIAPKADGTFSRVHVLNTWALWWGIVIMVVASIVGLFSKPEIFVEAFRGFGRKRTDKKDVLGHIELPVKISFIGVPILGVIGAWMAHAWFGVSWAFGLSALPLIIVLALIAASSTALTGITPSSSLSKIPQFLFGAFDPKHPPTNLMTGVMCVEVASNSSNLLMDIKPGYMLGAKPRQQAVGHVIGIVAGAIASTPLYYLLFLSDYEPGKNVQAVMAPEGGQFGFPSAIQWKGVSDLVTAIFGGGTGKLLTRSIIISMVVAAIAGLVMEVLRIRTRGRFPLSPLAIGLGVVLPPDSTIAMFAGAAFFWWMHKKYGEKKETMGHKRWIGGHEPICAGLIAGAAIIGIADILVKVFLL
ncbi:MAG: OPT family oligopeptide transporter [Polyangiaceae bacterium]|nr:OPT family oligopeptide transporter [Polyangiaceae bacterium]